MGTFPVEQRPASRHQGISAPWHQGIKASRHQAPWQQCSKTDLLLSRARKSCHTSCTMGTTTASASFIVLSVLICGSLADQHQHHHRQHQHQHQHHRLPQLRHQLRPLPRSLSPLRHLFTPKNNRADRHLRLGRGFRNVGRPRQRFLPHLQRLQRLARPIPKIAYQEASQIPGYETFQLHEVIRKREGTEIFEGGRKPDVIRIVKPPIIKSTTDFSDKIDERSLNKVDIPAQQLSLTPVQEIRSR